MGVLDRYRQDVARVGAELATTLGWELATERPDEKTRALHGTRGGRRVRIELDEMYGIHGVACAIRAVPLKSLRLSDEQSMFASGPKVTDHLKVHTLFDGEALWRLLPEETRRAIAELLAAPSSDLTLANEEITAMLGPIGLVRDPDAAPKCLASLDRLIAIAAVVEEHWNVDPQTVGRGFAGGAVVPAPSASQPAVRVPTRHVRTCEPLTVAAAAIPARDALVAAHADVIMEPFPVVDPMQGDLAAITGRVVLLPPVAPSKWPKEVVGKALAAGDAERGWYFVRTKEAGLARVLRAAERYERATITKLGDAPYALIARVTGKPRIVVLDGEGVVGLDVETLGALIGDRVFVDATQVVEGESPFAGEGSRTTTSAS